MSHIFCTALFTNNNIKIVILINAILMDLPISPSRIFTVAKGPSAKA
jgi:hypothetical protein